MAFVVFIPALLNEEATDAPAHGDDLARRHTADLRSVGASWLRCMLGLAADAAAHMLRRVWCHAEKICFDGSSCRSKVRGTGVNRMVRGGRQRHGLPMEHWCSVDVATISADHRSPTGSRDQTSRVSKLPFWRGATSSNALGFKELQAYLFLRTVGNFLLVF